MFQNFIGPFDDHKSTEFQCHSGTRVTISQPCSRVANVPGENANPLPPAGTWEHVGRPKMCVTGWSSKIFFGSEHSLVPEGPGTFFAECIDIYTLSGLLGAEEDEVGLLLRKVDTHTLHRPGTGTLELRTPSWNTCTSPDSRIVNQPTVLRSILGIFLFSFMEQHRKDCRCVFVCHKRFQSGTTSSKMGKLLALSLRTQKFFSHESKWLFQVRAMCNSPRSSWPLGSMTTTQWPFSFKFFF